MRIRVGLALGLWLMAASLLPAQSIKMPSEVTVPIGRFATVGVKFEGKDFAYNVCGSDLDAFREYNPDPTVCCLRIIGYQPGIAYVVTSVAAGDKVATAVCKITIGSGPPPVPPGPGPTPPNPPTPPQPPAPIPGDGLRVLMVYDSTGLGAMPKDQERIFTDGAVRDYLNSKCVTGPDGKTKEWRIWDQIVDTAGESKTWQDAMKRQRDKLPWLVISNGKTGYEGPLPATPEDLLTLLKKYGG